MSTRIPSFAGCVLIVTGFLAALVGCGKKEAVSAAPPEVLVTPAATRDVPVYQEWIGTINGSENADVRAQVEGRLIKRSYEEGSIVKKGDPLFEIDPRTYEAEVAQAKSNLEQSKAAAVAAKAEAEREQKLFDQKVISVQEYTNKMQLNEASQAKVKALEAALEDAQVKLGYCHITSPVEGIAGLAKAQVGNLVGEGGSNTELTGVSTLDPAKLIFPVSESEYLLYHKRAEETLSKPVDQRPETIEVILADGSTFPNKARLLAVDRQVNQSTGTIEITALVRNPGCLLRPGFYAQARVVANVLKDAVLVPQRAVSEVQGSYQLGVIASDGKAEIRPVKVGVRSGTDWVISSGLKAGEKVVVEGLQKIKAGAPVTAKPWTPPAEKPKETNDEANTTAR